MNQVSNITDCIASLEATYDVLKYINDVEKRTSLTETELMLVRLRSNQSAQFINTNSVALTPSLESDSYFEATDVVASMETFGAAIAAGFTAAMTAIQKLLAHIKGMFKTGMEKLSELSLRLRNVKNKLTKDKDYFITFPLLIPDNDNPIENLKALSASVDSFCKGEIDENLNRTSANIGTSNTQKIKMKGAAIVPIVEKVAGEVDKVVAYYNGVVKKRLAEEEAKVNRKLDASEMRVMEGSLNKLSRNYRFIKNNLHSVSVKEIDLHKEKKSDNDFSRRQRKHEIKNIK